MSHYLRVRQAVARVVSARIDLVVILAIQVLVGVTTLVLLSRGGASSDQPKAGQEITMLNELAQSYYTEFDRWPERNGGVWELAVSGQIDFRSDRRVYQRLYKSYRWEKSTKSFTKRRD